MLKNCGYKESKSDKCLFLEMEPWPQRRCSAMIGHDVDSLYIAGYRGKLAQILSVLGLEGTLRIECLNRDVCTFNRMNIVNKSDSLFAEVPYRVLDGFMDLSAHSSDAVIRNRVLTIKRISSVVRPDILADIDYAETSEGFDYTFANELVKDLQACPYSLFQMDGNGIDRIRIFLDFHRSIEHVEIQECVGLVTVGSAYSQTLVMVKKSSYVEDDCTEMRHCNCEAISFFSNLLADVDRIQESLHEIDPIRTIKLEIITHDYDFMHQIRYGSENEGHLKRFIYRARSMLLRYLVSWDYTRSDWLTQMFDEEEWRQIKVFILRLLRTKAIM